MTMGERLSQQPEQPIRLEVGEPAAKPFEYLIELPSPDLAHRTLDESLNVLISRDLELNGIKANLVLTVAELDRTRRFETPLGKATYETSYEDGKVTETKSPLSIALYSHLNAQEFEALKSYDLELKIGEQTYRLDCPENITLEELTGFYEDKKERINLVSDDPVNSIGEEVDILLPWDPRKLSTIEASLVEKLSK